MSAPVLSSRLLKSRRPSRALGVLVAVASVAAATALIYPLKRVSPVLSLGVLYVLAVVVVSTLWGLAFGIGTSVLSAAAFNYFHLPPRGRFDLADERDWVSLLVFVIVAVTTGLVAELARLRGEEAERRRQEADLAAEMAQLLLGTAELEEALRLSADRLAAAVGVGWAAISLGDEDTAGDSLAFALQTDGRRVGTLMLPATLSREERTRIGARVVPSLESLLAAALRSSELRSEVVETAALRRSDELKTAVLRSVSHDLRTPLTAILMAATALDARRPTRAKVGEVREQVLDAGTRLWRLIEKLLDLSVLEAGRAEPRSGWYSIEEVLQEAIEQTPCSPTCRCCRAIRGSSRERSSTCWRTPRATRARSRSRSARGPWAGASVSSSPIRAPGFRAASGSASSCPSIARRGRRRRRRGRDWVSRSRGDSSSSTAAGSASSRCRARARAS